MEINYWIFDTSVLSNFALIGEFELLKKTLSKKIAIPEEVKKEFLYGVKKACLPSTNVEWLKVVKKNQEEERLFKNLCLKLGSGESCCLAVALNRKWKFFTDDIEARGAAQGLEISVSGTVGLLVYLVCKKHIDIEKGNLMLKHMIQKGYYSPVKTLDDFLK